MTKNTLFHFLFFWKLQLVLTVIILQVEGKIKKLRIEKYTEELKHNDNNGSQLTILYIMYYFATKHFVDNNLPVRLCQLCHYLQPLRNSVKTTTADIE